MLDDSYLVRGLNALSRAHLGHYFADGHRGGAIVSACYLCRENPVEAGVAEAIAALIDHHWSHTDLCAPFPKEPADPSLLGRVAAALEASIGRLRQAGHNVILPTLALKAFADVPDAITPSRVDGVCRLIEAFQPFDDVALDQAEPIPDFGAREPMAEFILAETLRTIEAFVGRGQGWSGHMLTYGRALIDLAELGYSELAARGHHAFKLYITRTRMGPLATDRTIPEHPPIDALPLELAYWERRGQSPVGIGHCFKYPYGFYGLLALNRDPGLEAKCLAECYHVF